MNESVLWFLFGLGKMLIDWKVYSFFIFLLKKIKCLTGSRVRDQKTGKITGVLSLA